MSAYSRKRNRRGQKNRFDGEEDINPLSYMANMSDAMLILAVGIMLALIVHWNVDVSVSANGEAGESTTAEQNNDEINTSEAITFEEDNMEELDDGEDLDNGTGMDKLGEVYYDAASGKYYVIKNEEQ